MYQMYQIVILVQLAMAGGCPSMLCSCDVENVVECSNRRLEKIPSWDDDVTSNEVSSSKVFRSVNLNNNEIYSVQPAAFAGLHVTRIDLSNNQLIGVSPKAFREVQDTLEELNLSGTGLRVLHWATFSTLHLLKSLDLSRNAFFALPIGLFESLGKLGSLDLSHNEIASLKEGSLKGLSGLKELNLMDNNIEELEAQVFLDTRRLTSLNLNSNHLTYISQLAFEGLEHMATLQMDKNNISYIEDEAFVFMPYLQHLSLSDNSIFTLSSRTLHGLFQLQELQLSNNDMEIIATTAFNGMEQLQTLNLQKNDLTQLGEGLTIPPGLSFLDHLDLQDNPLNCSCSISWIKYSLLSSRKCDVKGTCRSPSKYTGQDIKDYDVTSCSETSTEEVTGSVIKPTMDTNKFSGTGGYTNEP